MLFDYYKENYLVHNYTYDDTVKCDYDWYAPYDDERMLLDPVHYYDDWVVDCFTGAMDGYPVEELWSKDFWYSLNYDDDYMIATDPDFYNDWIMKGCDDYYYLRDQFVDPNFWDALQPDDDYFNLENFPITFNDINLILLQIPFELIYKFAENMGLLNFCLNNINDDPHFSTKIQFIDYDTMEQVVIQVDTALLLSKSQLARSYICEFASLQPISIQIPCTESIRKVLLKMFSGSSLWSGCLTSFEFEILLKIVDYLDMSLS